jgi:hypothetical protein
MVIIYVETGSGFELVDKVETALERTADEQNTFKRFNVDGPNTCLGGLCKDLRMGAVNVDLIRIGSDRSLEAYWFDVTFTAV